MQVGKCDFLYLIGLTAFLFTYHFGLNTKVYFELQGKLREQKEVVSETVLNPLAAISRLKDPLPQTDLLASVNNNSEDDSGTGGDGGEDEESEHSEEEGGLNNDQDAMDAEIAKASQEAREMLLEDSLLVIKLGDMRKSLEKGLLPAERRFSFQVPVAVEDLTSTEGMDDEELEFVIKLREKMDEWTAALEQIDRAAKNKALATDDAKWSEERFVADQHAWEEIELSRMRESVLEQKHKTLSGRDVIAADFYDVEAQDWDDFDEDGNKNSEKNEAEGKIKSSDKAKGSSGGKSGKRRKATKFPGDKDKNSDISSKGASPADGGNDDEGEDEESSGDVDYTELIEKTEAEISYWAQTSKKSVLVYGNNAYVNRDIETYSLAFSSAGFEIERRKKEGPLLTKALVNNEYPVLACLALKNDDCFSSSGIAKLKRYQRVNRITGLRAVLWSKDSFCKTISSGTKGEAMFTAYVFNCWIFPNEWSSAKEYAQAHPEASYIVKPLTMGGGKGISVVDGEKGLSKIRFKTHLVQNYLNNPHLIHQHKWDIRSYVLVTSTVPMRAYVYSRGLVRFASAEYNPNARKGGKKAQFLTNTSVNKKYNHNVTEITWSFSDLQAHLDSGATPDENGMTPYNQLFKRIQTAVSVVFLSAEQEWRRYYASKGESCHNCFQIMGVDLIVDSEMNPRVIEVNGQPNMKLSKNRNDHYSVSKMNMMKDMVHMVFKEDMIAKELVQAMDGLDDSTLRALTKNEWVYVLEYLKERKHRGQWQKVYPNLENAHMHSMFLEQQKHNPARLALHDVLMHLEENTLNLQQD